MKNVAKRILMILTMAAILFPYQITYAADTEYFDLAMPIKYIGDDPDPPENKIKNEPLPPLLAVVPVLIGILAIYLSLKKYNIIVYVTAIFRGNKRVNISRTPQL